MSFFHVVIVVMQTIMEQRNVLLYVRHEFDTRMSFKNAFSLMKGMYFWVSFNGSLSQSTLADWTILYTRSWHSQCLSGCTGISAHILWTLDRPVVDIDGILCSTSLFTTLVKSDLRRWIETSFTDCVISWTQSRSTIQLSRRCRYPAILKESARCKFAMVPIL